MQHWLEIGGKRNEPDSINITNQYRNKRSVNNLQNLSFAESLQEENFLTKFQCLRCQGLDIELSCQAICTRSYDIDAILNSVKGNECGVYLKQTR